MKRKQQKTRPTYVDGFALVVSKKNLKAYKEMAKIGGEVWMKYGALDYKECVMDDPKPWKQAKTTFSNILKIKPSETVVFSYIVYKSRAHRDQVNAKVMKDSMMNAEKWKDKPMPFDMARMATAGFKIIVDA